MKEDSTSTADTPTVHHPRKQKLWAETIKAMRLEPGIQRSELDSIAQNISQGVNLPFLSSPPYINYSNTKTVEEHSTAVL
jgi:hypothetical protein